MANQNKKILTIVGARPQFIKAAMFSYALQDYKLDEVLVHTGQHYDSNMSQIFFNELGIAEPRYRLDINNLSHAAMTGTMLIELEKIINQEQPDAVLVYGDTNSTLSGALTAAKLHIPVIHIEAGLRSFNKAMPEEINRILTDHVSSLLFCPTKTAVEHLRKENITENIILSGDIMQDLIHFVKQRDHSDHSDHNDLLKQLGIESTDYLLLTLHREENTNDVNRLNILLEYTNNFAIENNLKVLFAIHPRTKNICAKNNISLDKFILSEPLSYFEMQFIMNKAKLIFTDSGGMQKEAYFHRVPCVTLRDQTEWVETIDCGWNRLWTDADYTHRVEITEYNSRQSNKTVAAGIIENILDYLA